MMLDLTRPFTRAAAVRAGLSDRQLGRPRFRRLLHRVYVSADVAPTPDLRSAAALLLHGPAAVLSHTSTARLVGAPVPDDGIEHVTVPHPDQRRRQRELACHVAALEPGEVRLLRGLRVTSPERLFVDMASALSLVDLVVLAGLPEPVVNLRIRDDQGVVTTRLDLSWPEHRLALEYDGRHHVERIDQWERGHERRDALENDGWRLIVVTAKGIYKEPEVTLDRIRGALRERGARVGALDERWRRHFA